LLTCTRLFYNIFRDSQNLKIPLLWTRGTKLIAILRMLNSLSIYKNIHIGFSSCLCACTYVHRYLILSSSLNCSTRSRSLLLSPFNKQPLDCLWCLCSACYLNSFVFWDMLPCSLMEVSSACYLFHSSFFAWHTLQLWRWSRQVPPQTLVNSPVHMALYSRI
jgi:hypothetical protein